MSRDRTLYLLQQAEFVPPTSLEEATIRIADLQRELRNCHRRLRNAPGPDQARESKALLQALLGEYRALKGWVAAYHAMKSVQRAQKRAAQKSFDAHRARWEEVLAQHPDLVQAQTPEDLLFCAYAHIVQQVRARTAGATDREQVLLSRMEACLKDHVCVSS